MARRDYRSVRHVRPGHDQDNGCGMGAVGCSNGDIASRARGRRHRDVTTHGSAASPGTVTRPAGDDSAILGRVRRGNRRLCDGQSPLCEWSLGHAAGVEYRDHRAAFHPARVDLSTGLATTRSACTSARSPPSPCWRFQPPTRSAPCVSGTCFRAWVWRRLSGWSRGATFARRAENLQRFGRHNDTINSVSRVNRGHRPLYRALAPSPR